ncbi:hypothetical protein SAMN05421504_11377 [Amycolatopsis xylanica]|uniref:Fe-S cluster assembly iron-binding protein IscA n=1 Tax=Amycolatopsis xylanica TaxID=589385 RepID=A0A1H3SBF9_9PSEU|nr:hypothetical protein [Amycolatopsis xylanica]SDZ34905.1 hypothetical protein SAMN05421504_11377 [Amycolatopsis xylanica]
MKVSTEAAREIHGLMAAEGVVPEGGLRVDALADQPPGDAVAIQTEVAATGTETDLVFADEETGARVFLDLASAEVVGDRTLVVGARAGEFEVR